MVITTILVRRRRRATLGLAPAGGRPLAACFLVIDLAFFAANILKVPHGGWFPLLLGAVHLHADDDLEARARRSSPSGCGARAAARARSCDELDDRRRTGSPGTAVFMTSNPRARPAGAAAQPQAQQGAARAGRAAPRRRPRSPARARGRAPAGRAARRRASIASWRATASCRRRTSRWPCAWPRRKGSGSTSSAPPSTSAARPSCPAAARACRSGRTTCST